MAKTQKRGKKTPGTTAKPKRSRGKIDLDAIEDPELRQWAKEVDRRRKEQTDPKRQPFVFSKTETDEGQRQNIYRRKVKPVEAKAVLKTLRRRSGAAKIQEDINLARKAWQRAVGDDIASETQVCALVKGVLTIEVSSSSLLQEIRQFHHQVIFSDLSDIWQASQPLITIKYRLGRK